MPANEKVTPVAAAVTALSTLLCCLPPTLAIAAATGSVGVFVAAYQPWFGAMSVGLLVIGVLQLRRARACGVRRTSSVIVMGVSAAIVVLAVLFPQMIAIVLADILP